MTTADRVQDLTSREWLRSSRQSVVDFVTNPKWAEYDWWRPLDWRGGRLRGIEAPRGHFVGARLWKANLSYGRMEEADFTRADLAGGSLRKSKLRGAMFRDAVLAAVDLRGADLRDADFTGADLAQAKLQGADLTGAVLDGADVSDAVFGDEDGSAVGVTEEQIRRARWEEPPVLAESTSARNGV